MIEKGKNGGTTERNFGKGKLLGKEDEIIRLYLSGMTTVEIAKKFDTSHRNIYYVLKKAQVWGKANLPFKCPKCGLTFSNITSLRNHIDFAHVRGGKRKKVSDSEIIKAFHNYCNGKESTKDIIRRLGISMSSLLKRWYRIFGKEQVLSATKKMEGYYISRAKFRPPPKEVVRKLFEEYKKIPYSLRQFAKERGLNANTVAKWFKHYFPKEYEEHKKEKKRMVARLTYEKTFLCNGGIKWRYAKGRRLEYQIRDLLIENGWLAFRLAGSKPFDVIALKKGQILLVECSHVDMTKSEMEKLWSLAVRAGGKAIFVKKDKGKISVFLIEKTEKIPISLEKVLRLKSK